MATNDQRNERKSDEIRVKLNGALPFHRQRYSEHRGKLGFGRAVITTPQTSVMCLVCTYDTVCVGILDVLQRLTVGC